MKNIQKIFNPHHLFHVYFRQIAPTFLFHEIPAMSYQKKIWNALSIKKKRAKQFFKDISNFMSIIESFINSRHKNADLSLSALCCLDF